MCLLQHLTRRLWVLRYLNFLCIGCASGKGRGLVVTEDVKAGQLLAVGNPLGIARMDASDFGFQIDIQNCRMVSTSYLPFTN